MISLFSAGSSASPSPREPPGPHSDNSTYQELTRGVAWNPGLLIRMVVPANGSRTGLCWIHRGVYVLLLAAEATQVLEDDTVEVSQE